MGIRIDALDADAAATLQHVVPAMKDGKTVKLTVAQINALNAAAEHAVTAKAAIVDADERNLLDSADTFKRKKLTYANLVTAMLASIFNGTRTIANATFTGGSFRLRNAATAFYQSFDVSGLTANRTVKMANRDTDFSSLGWELIQEQNASAGSASLDFVDKLSSVFDEYELVISRVRLSNAASLDARVRYQAPLG